MSGIGAFAMVCSVLAGCSRTTHSGVEIHGTVQVAGAPLARGSISFLPTAGSGPAATAVIEDGKFHLAAADGPLAGSHKVLIQRDVDYKQQVLSARDAITPPAAVQSRWESAVDLPPTHYTCDLNLN